MSTTASKEAGAPDRGPKPIEQVEGVAIRFAGDSGDGMQLAGTQFTSTSAILGNDVSTLPDYPAEIRAPAGTLGGVSGFQINFSSTDIFTPGDKVDALIAMNPAALKTNVRDLSEGGILIVNTDEFTETNLERAKYDKNPLETDELSGYRVYKIPITQQTLEAVQEAGLGAKDAARCRNFYALGLTFWLFDRPLDTTLNWIQSKFGKVPAVANANRLALRAGYDYGETAEIFPTRFRVRPAKLQPGTYRNLTGNQAAALGVLTAARLAGRPLVYGAYPITPASDILHELARYKSFDVRCFQAEDEIAAFASMIGAAFAGAIAVTGTSGPGIALKMEGIGLAVMTELPCVIINVQRGGPSTGLPTKTEQADLLQAVFGRHGECPLPVLAAQSAPDCFWAALEAVRVAVEYMTPVILLTDGYLANGSEPWRIPSDAELPKINPRFATDPAGFKPYTRDSRLVRPWAIPGTPGLEHRIGGLEKLDVTGDVSYDALNHHRMVSFRAEKVAGIANELPPQEVFGAPSGDLLVVSWGGTFGCVRSAVQRARARDLNVSHMHLRWLVPMSSNVGTILGKFRRVLVPEINLGQLRFLLRGNYGVAAEGLNRVEGRPLTINEVYERITELTGAD